MFEDQDLVEGLMQLPQTKTFAQAESIVITTHSSPGLSCCAAVRCPDLTCIKLCTSTMADRAVSSQPASAEMSTKAWSTVRR